MKCLIVGLGNIGEQYRYTRHNIGFAIVDHLAKKINTQFQTDRLGDISHKNYKGKSIFLLKPSTFMNHSGKSINYWLKKNKIDIQNLLIVTDDIALPFGKLRFKSQGSSGGHNGLKSVVEYLLSQQFSRLKFGIGCQFSQGKQALYVLENFSAIEKKYLEALIEKSCQAILDYCTQGITHVMNMYN